MKLKLHEELFCVARLGAHDSVPTWIVGSSFCSITRTAEELSIVCAQEPVPETIRAERDWNLIQVIGPLDFALVGLIYSLSSVLADKNISIFVVSSFDTDYLLVKASRAQEAVMALEAAGHEFIRSS